MPASRQAHWKAKIDVAYEVVNWGRSPNWAKVPDYSDPFSDDNTYGLNDDADEPDDPLDDDEDDDDQESQDLLDHVDEDLDDWDLNTRRGAQAETERDYEEDDWEAQEAERGILGDEYDD